MGKGTILDEEGEGLYKVELDFGADELQNQINIVQSNIDVLDQAITNKLAQLAEKQSAKNAALVLMDAAIANLRNAAPEDYVKTRQALADASAAAQQASIEEQTVALEHERLRLQRNDLENKKLELANVPVSEQRLMWCTTYTEDAEGDVSTIEIDADPPAILIAPEGEPYDPVAYGRFYTPMAMSPSAAFLNAALFPGWQKHSPTYRVGQIKNIDRNKDTCTVILDDTPSRAQELDINERKSFSAVPIEYLTCNSRAFEFGDRVVVRFENQDATKPKVIGFEKEPRRCVNDIWVLASINNNTALFYQRYAVRLDWQTLEEKERRNWTPPWFTLFGETSNVNDVMQNSRGVPLVGTSAGPLLDARNGDVVHNLESAFQFTFFAATDKRIYQSVVNNPFSGDWLKTVNSYDAKSEELKASYDFADNQAGTVVAADTETVMLAALRFEGADELGAIRSMIFTLYTRDFQELLWQHKMPPRNGVSYLTEAAAIGENYVIVEHRYFNGTATITSWDVLAKEDGTLLRRIELQGTYSFETGTGLTRRGWTIRGDYLYTVFTTNVPLPQLSRLRVTKAHLITGNYFSPVGAEENVIDLFGELFVPPTVGPPPNFGDTTPQLTRYILSSGIC